MLKYSPRALPAIVKILERLNDLNVFVEDATAENIYKVFFRRLLPSNVRISKVFQCAGRSGVIAAAVDAKFNHLKHTIFLIDGDLFLLCGEKYFIPPNVFKLDMYCIENGLISLNSAENLAYECEPDHSLETVQFNLGLEEWFNDTIKILTPLFRRNYS